MANPSSAPLIVPERLGCVQHDTKLDGYLLAVVPTRMGMSGWELWEMARCLAGDVPRRPVPGWIRPSLRLAAPEPFRPVF